MTADGILLALGFLVVAVAAFCAIALACHAVTDPYLPPADAEDLDAMHDEWNRQ